MDNIVRFSTALAASRASAKNTLANVNRTELAGGAIDLYYCLPADKPATPQTAIGAAHHKFASAVIPTPSGTVVDNVLTLGTIAPTPSLLDLPDPSGQVFFARLLNSSASVMMDMDAGGVGSGAALILDDLVLVQNGLVTITSLTITE